MDTGSLEVALKAPESLHRAGRLAEAREAYLDVARRFPGEAEPHFRIALVDAEQGRLDDAELSLRRAIAIAGRMHYHFALGDVLERRGRHADAIGEFQRAVASAPESAPARFRLGTALVSVGRAEEGVEHLAVAARLRPGEARYWNNLAHACLASGRHSQAQEALERTVALDSAHRGAWNELGALHARARRYVTALGCLVKATELDPSNASAWERLGLCRIELGEVPDAIRAYERAEAVGGDDAARLGSARLFAMHFDARRDAATMAAAHREWADRHAPAASLPAFLVNRDPDRTLHIGYVSPRFSRSSIAFLLPRHLECHDRSRFRISCYATARVQDDVTRRIRAADVTWVECEGLSDRELAERMRRDGVDVAIDLAGHTPGHRLAAFALRPAPVCGTWLDYFDTTGVESIDFLVTDAVSTPPDGRQVFTERPVRLQGLRYAWEPPPYAPDVRPPRGEQGIRFGAFTRLAKISDATVQAWAALLDRVPEGRIVVKAGALAGRDEREYFLGRMADGGLDRDRLELRPASDHRAMLDEYGDLDVVLDTFPYNGGVTTLEALWMGRPVVAVAGDSMISRQSLAILEAVGLPELCARDVGGYVDIAARLAADEGRRRSLADTLRARVGQSPVVDVEGFVRGFESALRSEWSRWCGEPAD